MLCHKSLNVTVITKDMFPEGQWSNFEVVKFLPGVLLLYNAHLTVVKSDTCHLYINNNMTVKKINSHTYYSPLQNYKGNRYKLLAYWFLGSIGSGETFIVIG